MINLIPPQGIRAAKREYVLRTAATALMLFGTIVLLLVAAHVPTYILVDAQIKTLELTAEKEAGREDAIKTAEAEVKRVQAVLAQLKKTPSKTREIDVVTEIEKYTSGAIELQNFTVTMENVKTDLIQVRGIAATREALAQFKNALENSPLFEKADIPISDLVRETNLPFTITLTLTKV